MTPEPHAKTEPPSKARLIEQIKGLVALGYGYEDIAILLELPKSQVRPFVIGGPL